MGGPRHTCTDLAEDFAELLETLPLCDPFILVAHSLGGFVARVFASRYPGKLAGLVLVDAAQEDTVRLAPALYGAMQLPPRRFDEPLWLTLGRHDKARHADPAFPANIGTREDLDLAACYEEVRATSTLGDLPLTIISAGRADLHRSHGATGAVADTEAAWEKMRDTCQERLLGLSTATKRIVAAASSHYVQRDQPELVIAAIRDLLARARRKE